MPTEFRLRSKHQVCQINLIKTRRSALSAAFTDLRISERNKNDAIYGVKPRVKILEFLKIPHVRSCKILPRVTREKPAKVNENFQNHRQLQLDQRTYYAEGCIVIPKKSSRPEIR